jgi:hypothetical protein
MSKVVCFVGGASARIMVKITFDTIDSGLILVWYKTMKPLDFKPLLPPKANFNACQKPLYLSDPLDLSDRADAD